MKLKSLMGPILSLFLVPFLPAAPVLSSPGPQQEKPNAAEQAKLLLTGASASPSVLPSSTANQPKPPLRCQLLIVSLVTLGLVVFVLESTIPRNDVPFAIW
jgi:hypothetical protein